MKKLTLSIVASLAFIGAVFAQAQESKAASSTEAPAESSDYQKTDSRKVYPVAIGVPGSDTIDIVGLRVSFYNTCESVTGLDLALLGGMSQNAYGLQLALLKNEVYDKAGAIQIAVGANYASDFSGAQVGLWNENTLTQGVQVGLVNISNDVRGFQFGLVNTTEMIYGYQIGLINVIRGGRIPFMPIINFMLTED